MEYVKLNINKRVYENYLSKVALEFYKVSFFVALSI